MQKTVYRLALTAVAAFTASAGVMAPAQAPAQAAPAGEVPVRPAVAQAASASPRTYEPNVFAVTPATPDPLEVPGVPPLPQVTGPVTSGYVVSDATKVAWFNYLLREIDPRREGMWVLDLRGTHTSYYNRGNTYPLSYGKARPLVYIYGVGPWDTWRMRNVMWHERTHVLQTNFIGYSRALQVLGGVPGLEATAVCTEHIKGLPRPGWNCSYADRVRTMRMWSGLIR